MSSHLRVAVEGCGHGELHTIYSSVRLAAQAKGWDGVDLVIIGGDFQACRNNHDMNWLAVPPKYRAIHDFHEYYSGKRVAPYLTIFIGGNHEASNYLQELFYGGWVAPNIYYMGAANVLNVSGVRIAGLSGIWKGYDYRKPHYNISSVRSEDMKQLFHQREIDVRRLMLLRTQIDVGLSHDWPRGVESLGDLNSLLKRKKHFRDDIDKNQLGSPAGRYLLDRLKPCFWFSAHLHTKYAAIIEHQEQAVSSEQRPPTPSNPDEIDIDDEDQPTPALNLDQLDSGHDGTTNTARSMEADGVPEEAVSTPSFPKHTPITNRRTYFLALDKCLPRHDFLQLLEIPRSCSVPDTETIQLYYDPEWLAITRVFAADVEHQNLQKVGHQKAPEDRGREHYERLIDKERKWVDEELVSKGKLAVPSNFAIVAPIYDKNIRAKNQHDKPSLQPSPQTDSFCRMLGIRSPLE